MYDFYGNPPQNRKDLREWLTSWLEKPSDPLKPFTHNGETFIQELGFRRASYYHMVFRNLIANEYVWWVVSDNYEGNMSTFPSTRFASFEELLEKVIDDYYIQWKLSG